MQKNAILYVALAIVLVCSSVVFAASADLTYLNGSTANYFRYDRALTPYDVSSYLVGSDSYIDQSGVNPNVFLTVCHENLTVGQYVDVMYTSFNNSLAFSALNILPQITTAFVDNSSGLPCSVVDVSLSGVKTSYPGYLSAALIEANSSYSIDSINLSDALFINELGALLNGSFDIGIDVQGPPKTYFFLTNAIYDDQGVEIERNATQLLFSFVSNTNQSLIEQQIYAGETIEYGTQIDGGSTIWINDLLALEILTYAPCDPINQSGYYVMNASIFNFNRTCVDIQSTSNLVINFADEVIDGNGNESFAVDTCAVSVTDSTDVTFENLRSQDYYYGVCVVNSSVTIFGSGNSANFRGARVDEASRVTFVDVQFDNQESEIVAQNDSVVELFQVNFTSASIQSTFKNSIVTAVPSLPEPLGIEGLVDIEQFIRYEQNGLDAFAQISFLYTDPLPNNASTDNVSIYKYSFGANTTSIITLVNSTDNSTYNVSVTNSTGNWTQLFTLVSPSEGLIIGPNETTFSIFAPFAELAPPNPDPTPEPTPDPDPDPDPQSGASSGGGGSPSEATTQDESLNNDEIFLFNLTVPNNITLQQGEAGLIPFTLQNVGDADSPRVLIGPQARAGWDSTNQSVLPLFAGESFEGEVSLAPFEKEIPGTYFVPITLFVQNGQGEWVKALSEYTRVTVTPRASLKRLKILEYPPEIVYRSFDQIPVSFLAENIGDFDLNNISVVIDDIACLRSVDGDLYSVAIGEQATLSYVFNFGQEEECQTSLRFYSEDELVGFLPLNFVPGDSDGFLSLPQASTAKLLIWSIIFITWTIIAVLVIERRRKRLV